MKSLTIILTLFTLILGIVWYCTGEPNLWWVFSPTIVNVGLLIVRLGNPLGIGDAIASFGESLGEGLADIGDSCGDFGDGGGDGGD